MLKKLSLNEKVCRHFTAKAFCYINEEGYLRTRGTNDFEKMKTIDEIYSLRKQPTFRNATIGFPAKFHTNDTSLPRSG